MRVRGLQLHRSRTLAGIIERKRRGEDSRLRVQGMRARTP